MKIWTLLYITMELRAQTSHPKVGADIGPSTTHSLSCPDDCVQHRRQEPVEMNVTMGQWSPEPFEGGGSLCDPIKRLAVDSNQQAGWHGSHNLGGTSFAGSGLGAGGGSWQRFPTRWIPNVGPGRINVQQSFTRSCGIHSPWSTVHT